MSEFLMGRAELKNLPPELISNANTTVTRTNELLEKFGEYRKVSSGYRTAAANTAAGGAKKSNHMICAAVDLEDKDGRLDAWCLNNLSVLEEIGLWLEHPDNTVNWCHLQIYPPKSGNRIFKP